MSYPGNMNKRIIFQKKSDTDEVNENGFATENGWIDVVTVWAAAKTVSGQQYYRAAATQNERTTQWKIFYRKGLSDDMRILFDGRTFDIEAILPDDENKQTLTVISKEATM